MAAEDNVFGVQGRDYLCLALDSARRRLLDGLIVLQSVLLQALERSFYWLLELFTLALLLIFIK